MTEELIDKNELLSRISNVHTSGIFASDMRDAIIKIIDDMSVKQAKSFS